MLLDPLNYLKINNLFLNTELLPGFVSSNLYIMVKTYIHREAKFVFLLLLLFLP